jgi:hypothetical protein
MVSDNASTTGVLGTAAWIIETISGSAIDSFRHALGILEENSCNSFSCAWRVNKKALRANSMVNGQRFTPVDGVPVTIISDIFYIICSAIFIAIPRMLTRLCFPMCMFNPSFFVNNEHAVVERK